jgi:ABC-type nitrate/sulfonate/bicarbonate transport system permease component
MHAQLRACDILRHEQFIDSRPARNPPARILAQNRDEMATTFRGWACSFRQQNVRANGASLALPIGTPLDFLLGASKVFSKTFGPNFQIRPASPLAWLPLGLVLFSGFRENTAELAALFTIAICV